MSPSIQYASFLIRLWREERADPARTPIDWRSEVEHIQTGERWEFEALDQLVDFLRSQTQGLGEALRRDAPGQAASGASDCICDRTSRRPDCDPSSSRDRSLCTITQMIERGESR